MDVQGGFGGLTGFVDSNRISGICSTVLSSPSVGPPSEAKSCATSTFALWSSVAIGCLSTSAFLPLMLLPPVEWWPLLDRIQHVSAYVACVARVAEAAGRCKCWEFQLDRPALPREKVIERWRLSLLSWRSSWTRSWVVGLLTSDSSNMKCRWQRKTSQGSSVRNICFRNTTSKRFLVSHGQRGPFSSLTPLLPGKFSWMVCWFKNLLLRIQQAHWYCSIHVEHWKRKCLGMSADPRLVESSILKLLYLFKAWCVSLQPYIGHDSICLLCIMSPKKKISSLWWTISA